MAYCFYKERWKKWKKNSIGRWFDFYFWKSCNEEQWCWDINVINDMPQIKVMTNFGRLCQVAGDVSIKFLDKPWGGHLLKWNSILRKFLGRRFLLPVSEREFDVYLGEDHYFGNIEMFLKSYIVEGDILKQDCHIMDQQLFSMGQPGFWYYLVICGVASLLNAAVSNIT